MYAKNRHSELIQTDTKTATSVLSVDNPRNSEKVDKHTDAALQLTEPAMLSFTHYTDNLLGTTPTTSSSILLPI
jgi:hypothetical protein